MKDSRQMHFHGTFEGRSFRTTCKPNGVKDEPTGKYRQYYVTDDFGAVDCSDCRGVVERERRDRMARLTDEAIEIYYKVIVPMREEKAEARKAARKAKAARTSA